MTEPVAKRQKKTAADELICPITLELVLDPMTAEDGKVYEKWAIEKWFEMSTANEEDEEKEILSPWTGKLIGKNLSSAPWLKNHIEFLIDQNIIEGDLADDWKKRVLEDKAEKGNLKAMEDIGRHYRHGNCGFEKDYKLAFHWFTRARKAGSVAGTANCGDMLVYGFGVPKNYSQGILYLSKAAENGSDLAAYDLGTGFALGKYGLVPDAEEARGYLLLAVGGNCTHKHLSQRFIEHARGILGFLIETR